MKERVVSLMWGNAWDRYGQRFTETFEKHWPSEVELFIVTDRELPTARATQISLHGLPGYESFMVRNSGGPKKHWRYDAVEWAPQGMAPLAALEGLEDGDILAWFDADVETIADVPSGWLDGILAGYDVACLQRSGKPTELGFWVVCISPDTREMVEAFAGVYESDMVFGLPEQHSGYVFDAVLAGYCLNVRNLNVEDKRIHPWRKSVLAEFTVHHKGGKGR